MIMKRLNSVFFVLGLLCFAWLLPSCKKKELVFIIEGEIFDKSFNQNLIDGTLKIYRVPPASTQEILIAEKVVVDGSYSITFPRDKSERYVIRFYKDNYFEEVHEVYFSQLEIGKPYELNFQVEAFAMMNWVLVDELPNNTNNTVIVQKLDGRTGGQGACPNQQYEFFGGLLNDTLRCAVSGNQYIRFYIVNLPNYTLDSVYCNAFVDNYCQVNF